MAPLEGVIRDGAAAASPAVQPRLPPPDPSPGLLSRLKRLCLCGASAARRDAIAHREQQQDASASRTLPDARRLLHQPSRKSTSGGGVTEAAPSADLIDSQMGLNSSILISIRGGPIGREEDVTFSCMEPGHHPALDTAKATGMGAAAGDPQQQQQQAALLTTLTFAAAAQLQPLGSVGSQRLSPTALDLDAGGAAAASLYQYSISSYAIYAPSGAPASGANGQAPGASPGQGTRQSQPGTYIDLPKISGSPAPVSPLLLAPLAVRGLRPPPSAAAAAAAATAEDLAGADLAVVHVSPQVSMGAQGTSGRALGIPAAAATVNVAAQRLQTVESPSPLPPPPLGLQQRPFTPQALSEPPRPTRILQPQPPPSWSVNGQGQGGQGHSLAEHPSAPLPSLRPPLQPAVPPPGEMNMSLMSLEGSRRAAILTRQERPNRRPGSPPPGSASSCTSRSYGGGAPFDAVAAAAAAAAAVASPFVVPPTAVGSRAASGAHQRHQNYSVSGILAYGYGNGHVYGNGHGTGGGSGYGYLDDGRSAALSGHISGTLSPRLTSIQYGAAAAAAYGSAAMPYGPPLPSPPRSSVGLVVPSRVSVSGAGSVLSLPIETSSLLDVTAPRTGLLLEHTALEMSLQAPALDLWAAAALVAPTSRIAQGAYGVVYRGLWHGCTCAVKLMLAASTENLSSQLTEVFLCKALSCHPNIVQTFDCNVWRITPDTLQAVRSFCGSGTAFGGGGLYGAFGGGGGSAVAGAAPYDNSLPTAAMLQSAASMWLGATPSMGLSAAPSGAPSASSNIGPYGLAAMAAFAPVNADLVAGALAGMGSSSFAAPPLDAATVAALAAAAVPAATEVAARLGPTAAEASVAAVMGAWSGRERLGHADADARPSGSPPLAAAATTGDAGVAAAVELASAAAEQQQQQLQQHEQARVRPHLCSAPSEAAPAPVLVQSAPLPLDSVRDFMPLGEGPLQEGTSALGSQGDSSPPSPRPSLVGTEHLNGPVAEQPQQQPHHQQQQEQGACSGSLVLSGVLPNLSPPVSLPASLPPSSQLMAAGSGAPSSARAELTSTLQSQQQLGREQQWPRQRPGSQQEGGDSRRSAGGRGLQENERQQQQQKQQVQGAQEAAEPGTRPGQESHKQQQPLLLQERQQRQQEQVQHGTYPESRAANPTSSGSLPGQLEIGGVAAVRLSNGVPSAAQGPGTDAPAPADATALAPAWALRGPMGAEAAGSQMLQGPPSSAASPEQQPHNSSAGSAADGGGCGTGRVSTSSVLPAAEDAASPTAPAAAAAAAATATHPSHLTFSTVGPAAPAPSASTFAAAGAAALIGGGPLASRFASSTASRNFIDGRWPSPDASSRGPSPAPVRSNSFSRHASGVAGGTAAAVAMAGRVGSAATGVVPLSATQAASMMGLSPAGLSVGLCSSPISSGVLPPSLLQPCSASGTCRQFPDRAFTLTGPGAPPSGAGGFGGGGSASAGGPGPLQARSAVSMGDESDAVAAMAGARSLAQVLNLLGARDGQLAVLVVMEECDRGSLQQLLSKAAAAVTAAVAAGNGGGGGSLRSLNLYAPFSGGGRYPPQAALRALAMTAREVALGMAFLHHNNIIHGDLKPGNVLLKSSRQDQRGFIVKISDFGLSRVLHHSSTPHHLLATGASGSGSDAGGGGEAQGRDGDGGDDGDFTGGTLDGTVPYLAPELINNGQRSKASDVWAYGVLLWQLVTGMRPYDGLMQWQIMAAVCSGEQLLNWPLEAHPALVHLGRACLSFNPRDRPTFAQVVRRLVALEGELRSEVGR